MFPSTRRQIYCFYIHFKIHRKHLSRLNKAFIAGEWVGSKSGKMMRVVNPANNQTLSCVPDMGLEEAQLALRAASNAFKWWQWTLAKERSKLLQRWCELILRDKGTLAQIITSESGKTIDEAREEVDYGCSFLKWFAASARLTTGEVVPSPWRGKKIIMTRQPIGVVSAITSWEFPLAMIARKVGAVLAAGCTCVVKPSEDTPLTALATVKLAQEAGIPDGVINMVTCHNKSAPSIGKLLCESKLVAGVAFTGSSTIGKLIYKQCAKGVKRIALELGGNAPFIVFKSADMDNVVRCALVAKFRNNGQSCVAANRFFIHTDMFNEFVSRMSHAMSSKLVLGDPMNENVNLGPLINMAHMQHVVDLIDDSVRKGVKVVVGGCPANEIGDKYYHPTLMTGVKKNMNIYHEEIRGPIISCIKFSSEEEALLYANEAKKKLAAYIFSNDLTQILRVLPQLKVGIVGVNEGLISAAESPFGGIEESGIGRIGGKQGIEEYMFHKYTLLCGVQDKIYI